MFELPDALLARIQFASAVRFHFLVLAIAIKLSSFPAVL